MDFQGLKMKKNAEKYADIHFNEEVLKIEKLKEEFQIILYIL